MPKTLYLFALRMLCIPSSVYFQPARKHWASKRSRQLPTAQLEVTQCSLRQTRSNYIESPKYHITLRPKKLSIYPLNITSPHISHPLPQLLLTLSPPPKILSSSALIPSSSNTPFLTFSPKPPCPYPNGGAPAR